MQYGVVGLPMPSIEIKLLDVPEAGYLSTNELPQGEVCIRGPSVTQGYYKRDDLNNDEAIFTKDGWLRTGDVGQWNKDGTLSVVDRIKNLVKLQSGEVCIPRIHFLTCQGRAHLISTSVHCLGTPRVGVQGLLASLKHLRSRESRCEAANRDHHPP